jgi:GAF domain-containing protein
MTLNLNQLTQFSQAGREVLHYLKQHLGFDLWMITRVNGDDWIVLQAEDQGYQVVEGDVLKWSDSFCSQMVQGLGPNIAPCAMQVITYANTPIAQKLPIEAYVGYPIVFADGELFGTLCGIDPKQKPTDLEKQAPLLSLLSQLLSRLLQLEWQHIQTLRENQRLANEALTDPLTGKYFNAASDFALCMPLVEMAGKDRIFRVSEPVYVYNVSEDLDSETNNRLAKQKETEQRIRQKPPRVRL